MNILNEQSKICKNISCHPVGDEIKKKKKKYNSIGENTKSEIEYTKRNDNCFYTVIIFFVSKIKVII